MREDGEKKEEETQCPLPDGVESWVQDVRGVWSDTPTSLSIRPSSPRLERETKGTSAHPTPFLRKSVGPGGTPDPGVKGIDTVPKVF